MAPTASALARRLARWVLQATLAVVAACGGGGGGGGTAPSADTTAQGDALRGAPPTCTAGFTAQAPFTVNSLGAGSHQQARFAGPLDGGGFALAWLSHLPTDSNLSGRLQWQAFDADGNALAPPQDLPYAEDVGSPQDVAVLVQPSGRIIVAYVVTRVVDASNPFGVDNMVLARVFEGGNALPGVITIATQNVDLRSRPALFNQPMLAGFDDGSFLAAWHITGRVKPQLLVQRVDAGGTLDGAQVQIDSLGGLGPPREQLVPFADGGWMALTPWRTDFPESRPFTLVTQVGVRHPLDAGTTLPWGSVLLQDARGLQVAEGPVDGTSVLQRFNPGGHAAGQPTALPLPPVGSLGLPDGGAALLLDNGGTIALQRIDARGDPVGPLVTTSAPTDARWGALPGGGVVLTWAVETAGGSQVVAQRVAASCS